jgi:hypothetical protein
MLYYSVALHSTSNIAVRRLPLGGGLCYTEWMECACLLRWWYMECTHMYG